MMPWRQQEVVYRWQVCVLRLLRGLRQKSKNSSGVWGPELGTLEWPMGRPGLVALRDIQISSG